MCTEAEEDLKKKGQGSCVGTVAVCECKRLEESAVRAHVCDSVKIVNCASKVGAGRQSSKRILLSVTEWRT